MFEYIVNKIKNNIAKILVFGINIALFAFGVIAIKDRDSARLAMQTEKTENFIPIDQKVLDSQEKIATDRENKMRDLNNSPKEIKQSQTTTQKTTTTPPDSSSDSSSSSSSSSKSKKKTKTS